MKLTRLCLFSLGYLHLIRRVCVSLSQGYRVGSEFWSLPPRFGDELSGITSTLTQTEQGKQKAVTRVAQPRSIRQESGTQPFFSVLPLLLGLHPAEIFDPSNLRLPL